MLLRNDHHWEGPAKIDGIHVDIVPDLWMGEDTLSRQAVSFDAGQLDFRFVSRDLAQPPFETIAELYPLPPRSWFFAFNPSIPPFDDRDFRTALVKSAR